MTSSAPAVVIGAGISGLVCAYALNKAGIDALVLEASPRVGGVICSERRDGFLLELGVAEQLLQAPANAPRYVLIGGKLKQVPLNPVAMLGSSLLSPTTKWKIARDAFGATSAPEIDESVAAFVRRKFGAELLDRLVAPFVSGIYAGDPERLSLRSAFPQLHDAEKSAGSVIRGLMRGAKSRKGARERPTLLSFRDGNAALVRVLAEKLGSKLRLGAEVLGIAVRPEAGAPRFELRLRQAGNQETLIAERLVMATPSDVAGVLLRDVNAAFEPVLGGIEYAPVAVVSLGYRREDVVHSLKGFGFLAPRSSGLHVLGSVWNSSLFPERAPAGHVLLTSFVGGATDPSAASLSVVELAELIHRELAPLLQIRAAPVFSHAQVYRHALPQYNIGHSERLIALQRLCAELPGLFVLGNYLRGPSIGNCVDLAMEASADIAGPSRST
jgi:oxygen-dependent protoporphyrinogen oxidase